MRSAGSPLRHYFNNHFEMVKAEVRGQRAADLAPVHAVLDRQAAELRGIGDAIAVAVAEGQMFVARQLAEVSAHAQAATETNARALETLERVAAMEPVWREALEHVHGVRSDVQVALGEVARIEAAVAALASRLEDRIAAVTERVPRSVLDVSDRDAAVANRMNAHDGYLSQAGLWVNEPLSAGFEGGSLQLNDVNERVGEIPFVFGQVASLPVGARVLDVGCCESVVSISLASLGYDVTALDPRPYPFEHPRLRVVTEPVERFTDDDGFDAVILLSTIEHLGVGSYGLGEGERLDLLAMRHLRTLLRPGGRLVLTTPFGISAVDELERTYDVAGVHELIEGFRLVGDPLVLVRRSRTEWITDRGGFSDVDDDRQRVVMLVATPEG